MVNTIQWGPIKTVLVNVRIIAATNKSIPDLIEGKTIPRRSLL